MMILTLAIGPELIAGLIAGAAVSALGAATQAVAANAQNKAVSKGQEEALKAAQAEATQVKREEALNKIKAAQESQKLIARIRVASGESGLSLDGSSMALINQASLDEATDQMTIRQNAALRVGSVLSGARQTVAGLQSQRRSGALEGLAAGLQGAQAGFSLGTGIYQATRPRADAGIPAAGATKIYPAFKPRG